MICFWCGKQGHGQWECKDKDSYMEWARSRGQNGGAKDVGCLHQDQPACLPRPKPETAPNSELNNMEMQAVRGATYRYINSFEVKNPFEALEVSDADFPDVPPGLVTHESKPKMPKWKKVEKPKKPKLKEISMLMRKEPKEIMNVEKGQEEYIEATIDSGASDSVANSRHAKACRVIPSEGSMEGIKYVSASGTVIDNEGEKHVQVETNGGKRRTLNLQIADVNRVLLSVSKICDAGNVVTFTSKGGNITNSST